MADVYRQVSLERLESALQEHPEVCQAAVLVQDLYRQNTDLQSKCLVAYVVMDKQSESAVRGPETIEIWPSEGEYQVYDDLLYSIMTEDDARRHAYQAAMRQTVRDKVVVDLGTGKDAILARWCVEAGARKVYAIEVLTAAYQHACQTIAELGLSDQITVLHGDAMQVQLPELADVCVGRFWDNCGIRRSSRHPCSRPSIFTRRGSVSAAT